jgi:hypothetical protein
MINKKRVTLLKEKGLINRKKAPTCGGSQAQPVQSGTKINPFPYFCGKWISLCAILYRGVLLTACAVFLFPPCLPGVDLPVKRQKRALRQRPLLR